ncbi:MAG: ThuA domain-containing protein [Clostridia bacterium]|nr:ThuA domain-containing protein [Clostridia bacterium]
MIKVTVWNEFYHEKTEEKVKAVYPEGMHKTIAEFLGKNEDMQVRTITLDDENCGITDELLEDTDVMIWWGHVRHGQVPDEIAVKVKEAVLRGMGIIFLHSAHHSKPFKLLMGTTCNLGWRESDDKERLWIIDHNHPIMEGITDRYFELEGEETYMEPFGIPDPDKLLMVGWYNGGEVFRSGCIWHRENGKVFYFQPGHETYPTFYNENVQRVITNAVRWAKPVYRIPELTCPWMPRIEK